MKIWRRKEFLFCFVIIWAAALFQGYALYQEKKEEDKTVEAFETLHLSSVEGCVEISAPIGKNYEKRDGKELFLTGLIRELNLADEPEFQYEEGTEKEEISYVKKADDEKVCISFITEKGEQSEETRGEYQYVYITYELKDNIEQLLQYKTKIERLMKMRNFAFFTSLSLKGSRTGEMTLEEKEEVTDRLFHSLEASVVEAVREEELYTVYGYSELLRNSISYGENEINLNLAFSYHEEESKTVFYLAMPYVQTDY